MNNKELREANFNKDKFKKILSLRGYSQNHLSKMTNITQSAISYYIAGKIKPSKKTVQVFANELDVDYEELVDNVGTVETIETNKDEGSDYQDILDIAQEMGNLRYKLIQMIQETGDDENVFNAQDIDFLHKVENIEDIEKLTPEEALKMLKKAHTERKKRRNCKERKHLIQLLLDGFLLKNPRIYITRVIENSKDWTYIPRVAEQLKQDDGLYDLRKEQRILGRDM
jgi:transcriptional regulator with XRE-family HTH domain